MIKIPRLERIIYSYGHIHPATLIGQDDIHGRRQFALSDKSDFYGCKEYFGEEIHGVGMPGMCDSQIYRPDGTCDISARYGVKWDDGRTLYFENNGKRRIPPEMASIVLGGGFVDPKYQYHCCVCTIEAFDPSLKFLEDKLVIQTASRLPDRGRLDFWIVEIDAFEDDGVTPIKMD